MQKQAFRMSLQLMLILLLLPLAACGGSGNSNTSSQAQSTSPTQPAKTKGPAQSVTITIGHHVDLTGPGANPMASIVKALDDMVRYYNEQDVIPGVELKVVAYDNHYDPARDIPGYEWLKEKGADVIFASVPSTASILKPVLKEDQMVAFALAPNEDALVPPGYVFAASYVPLKYRTYTLLKWVAENDPDFPKDRPAKLGGAGWTDGLSDPILAAAEEYARAHPDQYEWKGGYLTNFTFTWGSEVDKLKDCDYVIPPGMMTAFVREYRAAGGTAQFIGDSIHLAFLNLIDDAGLWDEIDDMLVLTSTRWWNEEGEIISLLKEVLHRYHSDTETDEIVRSGTGYLAGYSVYVMLDVLKKTVDRVSSASFTPQAMYETAQEYSFTMDGVEFYSYSDTKRYSLNYSGMYRVSAADEDVFRIVPEWLPVVLQP